MVALAAAPALAAPSAEAQRAHAELVQDVLPALDARRQRAQARVAAAQRWFAGDDLIESAFPELADVRLTDPLLVDGRLALLQQRAEARALERVVAVAPLLSRRDVDRFQRARTATLDAEEAADDLEHRLLSGLRGCLRTAPALTAPALDEARHSLQAWRPAAAAPAAPAPPDGAPPAPAAAEPVPDPARAAQALALSEADATFARLGRALVRHCTVPGDTTLATLLADELATLRTELDQPPATDIGRAVRDARVARVRASRALMEPAAASAAGELIQRWEWDRLRGRIQALEAELAALEAQSASGGLDDDLTVEVLEARNTERQQALADARTAQLTVQGQLNAQGAVDTTGAFRLQIANLEVQLAEKRATAAEQSLQRARRRSELGLELSATDDQVAAARAAAEAARARAAEEGAQGEVDADARLAAQIAAFREEYARLLSTGKSRHDRAIDTAEALTTALEEQRAAQTAAQGLGPLDPRRQAELDAVYVALRKIVTEARSEVSRCEDALSQARLHAADRMDKLPDASSIEVDEDHPRLAEWREVVGELQEELAAQPVAASAELNAALGLLAEAKADRRDARASASSEARRLAQRTFFSELRREIQEIGPMLQRAGRELLALGQRLPSFLFDLTAIGAFIKGSFEFVLVLGAWLYLRGRARRFGSDFAESAQAVRPQDESTTARIVQMIESRGINGDWRNLTTRMSMVGRRLVDVLTGLLVLKLLGGRVVAIELLVLAWTVFRGIQLVGDLAQLVLTVPGEDRPALGRADKRSRELWSATARLSLLWLGGSHFLERLTLDLLDGDRLHELVGGLSVAFAWGLVLLGLVAWGQSIHAALADIADDPLSSRLARPARNPVLRVPQTAVALLFLLGRSAARFGNGLVEGRGSLGWLRSAMARQTLRTMMDAPTAPIPGHLHEALAHFEDGRLGFCEEEDELTQAFAGWRAEGRRGMVAVTGQRGCGKSRLMRNLPALLDPALPVRSAEMDHEQTDPDAVLDWLMGAVAPEAPPPADGWTAEHAVAALVALPPSLMLVDDLHRCFLRAVGGFEALRQVLTVMHAASERHFWACGFHGETWAWLEGVRGAVNLGVFRKRVRVRELDDGRLRDWLEARCRAAGRTPRYDHLATTGLGSVDPARAEERARTAYWRLLADASRGNPRVAHTAWLTSLRQGEDETTVSVVLFEQRDASMLDEAGDMALFLLAALVVHDGLPVDLLASALNISVGEVRALCRRLQGLGVLSGDSLDRYYKVVPEWSAVVDRRLRQKHLLHRL